jgi:hypothetical protein
MGRIAFHQLKGKISVRARRGRIVLPFSERLGAKMLLHHF